MQYHCMNIKSNTIKTLNHCQITVDAANQPIFTHAKELKIQFPDKFGFDKYFCLFASLHIETPLLIIRGQVIKSSGLDEIICTYGLPIGGAYFDIKNQLTTVNDIKRARYSLQVGGCVIYAKLKQENIGSDALIFAWLANKSKISEMCFYWKVIHQLMIDFLVFVRSLILHCYINSYTGTLL